MKTLLISLALLAGTTTYTSASSYPVEQFAVPFGGVTIGEFLCDLPADGVERARQDILRMAIKDGHSEQSVIDLAYPAAQRMAGFQGADKQTLCIGLRLLVKRSSK